jgi:predicted nucleic acid-binding protein
VALIAQFLVDTSAAARMAHPAVRSRLEPLITGGADLLTAVLAAEHQQTVVHYDADFETAAEVLGFEHRWVAPRGSIR